MSPPRARIVKAGGDATLAPLLAPPPPTAPAYRRITREELEGRLAGERALHEGQARAEALLAEARAGAHEAIERAREDARAEGHAESLAGWLALRKRDEERHGSDDDRALSLAVVLAERLIGAELTLEPSRITAIAAGVVAEARGARRASLEAHPEDARTLREQLRGAGLGAEIVDVRDDPTLARGALRLHTDVGTIDAQLATRLERLAAALRDALA